MSKKPKQPTPAKKSIAQQHRDEKAQQLVWTYLFERDELNPCVLCGRQYQGYGLELVYGNHYACPSCVEELRPDLWKELSDYRKRYHKATLTDRELETRSAKIHDLMGIGLDDLYRRFVDWQKATTPVRRGS